MQALQMAHGEGFQRSHTAALRGTKGPHCVGGAAAGVGPGAAAVRNAQGLLPLQCSLCLGHLAAARCLVAAGPAVEVLQALQQ